MSCIINLDWWNCFSNPCFVLIIKRVTIYRLIKSQTDRIHENPISARNRIFATYSNSVERLIEEGFSSCMAKIVQLSFFIKKKMSPTDGFWLSLTWSQHLHIFLDFYSDSQLYTKSYTLAAFIAVCGAKRLDLQGLYINTYYILQQTGELCH